MGTLMNYPKFQAFDANGDPLIGGLVYTYVAGSVTEKVTYTDPACVTSNTNPVVLDSRGEAVIYLNGSYKFVLKDADGVTVWTFDNLSGGGSSSSGYNFYPSSSEADHGVAGTGGTLYDILTSVGTGTKATIRFLHSGSGSTTSYTVTTAIDMSTYPNISLVFDNGAMLAGAGAKTLYSPASVIAQPNQQIFTGAGTISWSKRGTVYPGWWGALGDGSTDDSAAIVAAGTSLSGGGTLQFLSGVTYIHNGETPIPLYSDVTIDLNGATLKQKAGNYGDTVVEFIGNETVVGYDAGQAYIENITIKGPGELDGNAANVTVTNARGICVMQGKDVKVDNLYIHDTSGSAGGGHGIIFGYSDGVSITRVKIYNSERQNINIQESIGVRISDCDLSTSRYRENIIVSSDDPVTLQAAEAFISDTYFYNLKTADNDNLFRISGQAIAHFDNCQFESIAQDIIGIRFNGLLAEKVFVSNCKFKTLSYGIEVNSSAESQIHVVNSHFEACLRGIETTTGSGSVFMAGSRVYNSTERPISIAYQKKAIIVGNEFDTGTRVQIDSAEQTVFLNNIIIGMTDANEAVLISGTPSTDTAIVSGNIVKDCASNQIYVTAEGLVFDNDTGYELVGGSTSHYRSMFYADLDLSGDIGNGVAWSSAIPADAMVTVTAEVTEAITFSGGGATWQIGDGSDHDRWGAGGAATVGIKMMPDNYTAGDSPMFFTNAALAVRVKPNAGTFTDGTVRIRVYATKFL